MMASVETLDRLTRHSTYRHTLSPPVVVTALHVVKSRPARYQYIPLPIAISAVPSNTHCTLHCYVTGSGHVLLLFCECDVYLAVCYHGTGTSADRQAGRQTDRCPLEETCLSFYRPAPSIVSSSLISAFHCVFPKLQTLHQVLYSAVCSVWVAAVQQQTDVTCGARAAEREGKWKGGTNLGGGRWQRCSGRCLGFDSSSC